MLDAYPTGLINLFWNGLAQANSGWSVTGSYLILSGALDGDSATFDLISGDHKSYMVSGGLTGFLFPYSGQEIYLNGVNLISGYDYVIAGNTLNLTSANTGINGVIFEYPIVLVPRTGQSSVVTGLSFWRNTSNTYLNGVRQENRGTYIEGALFDLLSGNSFSYSGLNIIFGADTYWET